VPTFLTTFPERFEVVVNNLSGKIPSEFGLLSNLGNFGAGRNHLNGTIPTEIGLMSSIATFSIGSNYLTGPIPQEFSNLQNLVFLNLASNAFTGTIPAALGAMTGLTAVNLAGNSFSGDVPPPICNSESISELVADCHLNGCPCCTGCADTLTPTLSPTIIATGAPSPSPTGRPSPHPTPLPSPGPTGSPVRPETPAPTDCEPQLNWVHDDKCIEVGQPLTFSFENCNPQFGDFIGIYDKREDSWNLPGPLLWTWSCGTQNCQGTPVKKTIVFDKDSVDKENGEWPLPKGDYFAYFVRNTGIPYEAFLSSEKIKVKDAGKC